MRVVTPSSLKWLINKRARIQGEILRIQKSLQQRQADVAKVIERLEADLLALDKIISLHEIPINPRLIEPVISHTKGRKSPYGKLSAAIVRCLKEAAGEPCSTHLVVAFVAERLPDPIEEKELPELRIAVRKRLGTLTRQGKIRRFHPAKTHQEGYWALPLESSSTKE